MTRSADLSEQSTADLVRRASEQLTGLVRDELRLAKAEMSAKVGRVGAGARMFGVAGVLALYAVGAFAATAILALALAMPAWLAALIVAVALLLVAGLLGLMGYTALKQAAPALPQETIDSVRADINAVTSELRGSSEPTAVEERGHR